MTQYVYGKNVVKQLLKSERKIHEILIVEGLKDRELIQQVEHARLPLKRMSRKKMDALFQNEHHQGVAAKIDEFKSYTLTEVLEAIPAGKQPLLILLDGIKDPHNLGAILRSADCVGADGIILGKHRSVPLNSTVAKVSTGAIDMVKVAYVSNLSQTLKQLKEQGFWVAAADAQNAQDYRSADYNVPLVLVIGSEGEGISPLVRKMCDYAIALPMAGSITSLNASVACAVLLYEIYAQRHPLK